MNPLFITKFRSFFASYRERLVPVKQFMQKHLEVICVGSLLILSLFVLGYRLNQLPVQSWDEGFYALMATDAGATPLMPSIYGKPWIEKPPLSIWIMAASFNAFGVNVIALRLPSLIFGMVSVLLLYKLGKELFNRRIGYTAAFLFATSPMFVAPHMSRTGDIDTMLLASVLGFVLSYVRSWKDSRAWNMVAVWAAAGLLLRGTPMLPVMLVVLIHSWLYRAPLSWSQRLKSLGIFLALALPWHIAAVALYGSDFIQGYLLHGLVSRINGAVDGHTGPWYYYITEYFIMQLRPLFLPAVAALVWGTYRWIRTKDRATGLLVMWFVINFSVLSLMSTKLYWYSMPTIPPLFILGVAALFAFLQKKSDDVLTGTSALVVTIFLFLPGWMPFSQWSPFLHGIFFLIALVGSFLWNRERTLRTYTLLVLCLFVLSGVSYTWRYMSLPKTTPVWQSLAIELATLPSLQTVLYDPSLGTIHGRFAPQQEWYLNIRGKQNVGLIDQKSLTAWLETPSAFRLILQEKDKALLPTLTNRLVCPEKKIDIYQLLIVPTLGVKDCPPVR